MTEIGIGVIGGGYMGKAHAVAFGSVGAQFNPQLRPRLEMIAASTPETSESYRRTYGFARATADWREVVADPRVEAIIVATPQALHRDICAAALALNKHLLCEKPLAAEHHEAVQIAQSAAQSPAVTMTGFNYIRTPVTQHALKMVHDGTLGKIASFRAEHTEDFFADPTAPLTWRSLGRANGAMGDLAPHILQATLAFMGPVDAVMAQIETVHTHRPDAQGETQEVTSDDQAFMLCQFASGVTGQLFFSRVATGRKMGYAYEIFGDKGALKFDQEDQNALHYYDANGPEETRGFRQILSGPAHPDYLPFCQGPGHGTGYQDQIIIEAYHFLEAIANGEPAWPGFDVGLEVSRLVEAAFVSDAERRWVRVDEIRAAE